MKKQYMYLAIASGILAIIFVVLLLIQAFSQKSSNQSSTVQPTGSTSDRSANYNNSSNNTQNPKITPAQTPDLVIKEFYNFYIPNFSSLLKTGAYKNSPYVSPELITFVNRQYDGTNDPIFCLSNRSQNATFDQATYSDDKTVAYVVIRDQSGKQIYDAELDNINGRWVIGTIQCL